MKANERDQLQSKVTAKPENKNIVKLRKEMIEKPPDKFHV